MTTYGDFPGVRVETVGGGITGVQIGAEEVLVVFAEADLEEGDATLNEPTRVTSRNSVKNAFGERDESPLTDAILAAWGNGANRNLTHGIPVEEVEEGDGEFDLAEALTNSEKIVSAGETAVFAIINDTEDDAQALEEFIPTLRSDYKMVKGVVGAEPNDGNMFDTETYENPLDNSSMFLHAPSREEGSRSVTGHVAGLFAGNSITNPVYNETISGVDNDLRQRLTRAEANDLRDERVIPLKQNGTVRVADNTSTADEDDWIRDFWRRRIVDRAILVAFEVGSAILGRINDEETRGAAEDLIDAEFQSMAADRLIERNTDDETNYFVEVEQDETDPDKVNIEIGVTPTGIVKRVDTTITIDT